MPAQVLRTLVHAEARVLWHTLVDSLENPQKYGMPMEATTVKTGEDTYHREYNLSGVRCEEEIAVDTGAREIRGEFAGRYGFAGKIIVRMVPTSVQNPMAPFDLQYYVDLGERGPVERLLGTLRQEQQRLKEVSEELERDELRGEPGARRFLHPS